MPLIKYSCTNKECEKTFSAFKKRAEDIVPTTPCKFCGFEAKRVLSSPTTSSKISIDNGIQPRALEVDPNISELREDWSKPPDRGD